ncbi:hypothetical protein Bhyg_11609 [Pseudolycoriella hygida]|uniref:N-acetyltransferase domain-containing protein n=1 Tax=Pseudolycoriella hygida TaxID=35572 RepID=A0A9Q0MVV9_9DIPT|nr:hypothetical protein Bhyg_11609 [Pseudolycoriella hygida]
MSCFQRPDTIPYPNVWLTFEVSDENGELVKYRIQDLPIERAEDAINHMKTHFLTEEIECRARNIVNDEASVEDFVNIWRYAIHADRLSLVCLKEGSEEFVGVNILFAEGKDANIDWKEYKSEHVKDMDLAAFYLFDQFDIFEHYQVDHYLSEYGLSVVPKYRRRGIALKLLEARKQLCKACGIKLTSTIFSSTESQRLAEKAGFEKNFEISYKELAEKRSNYTFDVQNKLSTLSLYSMRT